MRVLIAGGGTGGHIYPAVTIGKALQEKGAELLFVGTRRGLEKEIVPREGFEIEFIPVEGFPRKLSWRVVKAGWTALAGFRQAAAIVGRFQPDVCVGTGGYVAGPVVLAAALRRVPTLIQEQNALPGFTNRLLGRFARRIALGYEAAASAFPSAGDKLVVTGNPIRPEIVRMSRAEGAARLGLQASQRNVLIFGASQGARSINGAVVAGLDALLEIDAHYLHVTGRQGFETVVNALAGKGERLVPLSHGEGYVYNDRLRVVPYLYDMPAALAASDLVVGRAGALGIAEMTARGLPAILVPYPHAAANHQEKNARILEEAGAARVVLDRDLTPEKLVAHIRELLGDRRLLERMAQASKRLGRPDAVWDIVALIESLASERAPV